MHKTFAHLGVIYYEHLFHFYYVFYCREDQYIHINGTVDQRCSYIYYFT